jgi:ABC-type multidrug transport system ATPase subunit
MPAADESPAALRLEKVSHAFISAGRTTTALKEVTADAARGTVTGLIGPDGAGKTTLMRLAAGLLKLQRGRIEVLGIDVARSPDEARSRIGYMPQRFGLYEDLTVRENLDLYAKVQNVPAAERQARSGKLLHMTGLGPFLGRLAGRLSGGMKQKLGLACTLVRIPELLLLDEPTVGVDPVSRRELWAIIDQLVRTEQLTVMVSTAYLDEAERCQRVLLLHEGHLVATTDPASFAARTSGRSFHVSAEAISKRQLQEQLSRTPGVLDATIQGSFVRIVTEPDGQPLPKALPPRGTPLHIVAVPPPLRGQLRRRDQVDSRICCGHGTGRRTRGDPGNGRCERHPPTSPAGRIGCRRADHPRRSADAPFRRLRCRRCNFVRGTPRGDLRPAGCQRRGQVDDLPDALWPATCLGRHFARGRVRSAPRGSLRAWPYRLHGAEVLALR